MFTIPAQTSSMTQLITPELLISATVPEKRPLSDFCTWVLGNPDFADAIVGEVACNRTGIHEYILIRCRVTLSSSGEDHTVWLRLERHPGEKGVVNVSKSSTAMDTVQVHKNLKLLQPQTKYEPRGHFSYDAGSRSDGCNTALKLLHIADMVKCLIGYPARYSLLGANCRWLCYALLECLNECRPCYGGDWIGQPLQRSNSTTDTRFAVQMRDRYLEDQHPSCCSSKRRQDNNPTVSELVEMIAKLAQASLANNGGGARSSRDSAIYPANSRASIQIAPSNTQSTDSNNNCTCNPLQPCAPHTPTPVMTPNICQHHNGNSAGTSQWIDTPSHQHSRHSSAQSPGIMGNETYSSVGARSQSQSQHRQNPAVHASPSEYDYPDPHHNLNRHSSCCVHQTNQESCSQQSGTRVHIHEGQGYSSTRTRRESSESGLSSQNYDHSVRHQMNPGNRSVHYPSQFPQNYPPHMYHAQTSASFVNAGVQQRQEDFYNLATQAYIDQPHPRTRFPHHLFSIPETASFSARHDNRGFNVQQFYDEDAERFARPGHAGYPMHQREAPGARIPHIPSFGHPPAPVLGSTQGYPPYNQDDSYQPVTNGPPPHQHTGPPSRSWTSEVWGASGDGRPERCDSPGALGDDIAEYGNAEIHQQNTSTQQTSIRMPEPQY